MSFWPANTPSLQRTVNTNKIDSTDIHDHPNNIDKLLIGRYCSFFVNNLRSFLANRR